MQLSEVIKKEKAPQVFYSTKEVAEFMGVNYMTLYRLIKTKKIIPSKLIHSAGTRKVFLFKAEDVQSYYDSLSDSSNGEQNIDQQNLRGDTLGQKKISEGQNIRTGISDVPSEESGPAIPDKDQVHIQMEDQSVR